MPLTLTYISLYVKSQTKFHKTTTTKPQATDSVEATILTAVCALHHPRQLLQSRTNRRVCEGVLKSLAQVFHTGSLLLVLQSGYPEFQSSLSKGGGFLFSRTGETCEFLGS